MDGGAPQNEFEKYISRASFFVPEYRAKSAWAPHAPFAFWLVEALRPRVVVALGADVAYAYFGFCQAVKALGIDAKCYAIDMWQPDERAVNEEQLFDDITDHNEARYAAFSRLVRSTADQAVKHFSDGTVDLLHIDGCTTYDQAKHAFESW